MMVYLVAPARWGAASPKKVLAGTAEIADINRRLNELKIVQEVPQMSWKNLIKLKRSFTDSVPG